MAASSVALQDRVLDAAPDTVDFRDKLYVPTLIEVPPTRPLADYRKANPPILDQGREGACTGFGLAACANYLLRTRRTADQVEVSARMLYVLARRYDEWPGETYEGSSARGAMKGWHKHGVCAAEVFDDVTGGDLTATVAADALKRPLGAYFRVNHKDLVAMHSAIAEVGVLYATSVVHEGWGEVGKDGTIPRREKVIGGHAFAIVAYDEEGFWIQNSWGPGWGKEGFGHIGYDDWLANGTDVWVARLGAPVKLGQPGASADLRDGAPQAYEAYVYSNLRPYIVTAENDGILRGKGAYGLTPEGLRKIVTEDMPAKMAGWAKKRVLLYAHGGLVPEAHAIDYVAKRLDSALAAEVYPLSFIWRSDALTTIGNILADAGKRLKPEGTIGSALDFMIDRWDDTLEPAARFLGGKALWDEMKENAVGASKAAKGAARLAAQELPALMGAGVDEIHLSGHSAGAVFMGPLAQLIATEGVIAQGPLKGQQGLGLQIESVSMWAPACTVDLYRKTFAPLIAAGRIKRFGLYTLKDKMERDDDCAHIYNKSLLYLVANAFEDKFEILAPRNGTPLLGREVDVRRTRIDKDFGDAVEWIVTPDSDGRSDAQHHGGFDRDELTWKSTLKRITGRKAGAVDFALSRPAQARVRQQLNACLA